MLEPLLKLRDNGVSELQSLIREENWDYLAARLSVVKIGNLEKVKIVTSSSGFNFHDLKCILFNEAIVHKAPINIIILLLQHNFVPPEFQDKDIDEIIEHHKLLKEILVEYQERIEVPNYIRRPTMSMQSFINYCNFRDKYGDNYNYLIDTKKVLKSIFIWNFDKPSELQSFVDECTPSLNFEELLFVFLNKSYGYKINEHLIKEQINNYPCNEREKIKYEFILNLIDGDPQKIQKWLEDNSALLTDIQSCIIIQIFHKYNLLHDIETDIPEWVNNIKWHNSITAKRTIILDGIEKCSTTEKLKDFIYNSCRNDYVALNDLEILQAMFGKLYHIKSLSSMDEKDRLLGNEIAILKTFIKEIIHIAPHYIDINTIFESMSIFYSENNDKSPNRMCNIISNSIYCKTDLFLLNLGFNFKKLDIDNFKNIIDRSENLEFLKAFIRCSSTDPHIYNRNVRKKIADLAFTELRVCIHKLTKQRLRPTKNEIRNIDNAIIKKLQEHLNLLDELGLEIENFDAFIETIRNNFHYNHNIYLQNIQVIGYSKSNSKTIIKRLDDSELKSDNTNQNTILSFISKNLTDTYWKKGIITLASCYCVYKFTQIEPTEFVQRGLLVAGCATVIFLCFTRYSYKIDDTFPNNPAGNTHIN